MNYFMLTLRLLHIGAGVFWVGSALFATTLLVQAINATGASGQQVLQHLMAKSRMSPRLAAAGGITVLAGLILYWLDSDGFTSTWANSGPGIGFGLGGVAGLLGFIFGILVGRSNKALGALSMEIKGQPTPDQSAKLETLRKSQLRVSGLSTIFLILATILMAIARYFSF